MIKVAIKSSKGSLCTLLSVSCLWLSLLYLISGVDPAVVACAGAFSSWDSLRAWDGNVVTVVQDHLESYLELTSATELIGVFTCYHWSSEPHFCCGPSGSIVVVVVYSQIAVLFLFNGDINPSAL